MEEKSMPADANSNPQNFKYDLRDSEEFKQQISDLIVKCQNLDVVVRNECPKRKIDERIDDLRVVWQKIGLEKVINFMEQNKESIGAVLAPQIYLTVEDNNGRLALRFEKLFNLSSPKSEWPTDAIDAGYTRVYNMQSFYYQNSFVEDDDWFLQQQLQIIYDQENDES